MNSKVKGIIVCAVFVVCLGVAALALTLAGGEKEEDTSSNTSSAPVKEPEIEVLDFDRAQVKNIAITNEYGEINISQPKLGEEEWVVDQLEGVAQISSLTTSAATTASSLSAKAIAEENASDLSKYGLSEPKAKFTVSYSDYDKTEKTFLIGDESPDKGYYYLCEEGVGTVYTVSVNSLLPFLNKLEYFVSLTLLEAPADQNNWPQIDDLVVSRKEWDYQVKFKTAEVEQTAMASAQVMYEPIYMSLNISNSTDVTHGLWGLTASDTEKVFPGDEDFENYGINDPGTVVELYTDNGGEYVLKVGNPVYNTDESGNETQEIIAYYVYIEGVEGRDAIYLVSASKLPWTSFVMEDVITSLMTTNPIGDIDNITIKGEGADYTFSFTSDSEGRAAAVKLNGNEVDLSLTKSLYQEILNCPTNEIYFEQPEGDVYLTLSINLFDGGGDVLEFVRDTDRRSIVLLNGRPQFKIASTWTELLLENVQNVIDGKEIKKFV